MIVSGYKYIETSEDLSNKLFNGDDIEVESYFSFYDPPDSIGDIVLIGTSISLAVKGVITNMSYKYIPSRNFLGQTCQSSPSDTREMLHLSNVNKEN